MVQVDPIKPTLKAPGTQRLKPYYGEPPSNFAFKFNLRHYNEGEEEEEEEKPAPPPSKSHKKKAAAAAAAAAPPSSKSHKKGTAAAGAGKGGVGGGAAPGHKPVGPSRYNSPRRRMPFNSRYARYEGSKCVG